MGSSKKDLRYGSLLAIFDLLSIAALQTAPVCSGLKQHICIISRFFVGQESRHDLARSSSSGSLINKAEAIKVSSEGLPGEGASRLTLGAVGSLQFFIGRWPETSLGSLPHGPPKHHIKTWQIASSK